MNAKVTTNDKADKQGANQCGLLLFKLDSQRLFAIGTLKVQELLPVPKFRPMPAVMPAILGAANIRGETMPIVDLAHAVGFTPIPEEERHNAFVIVTDCLRTKIAFMVRQIDRIIELGWDEIYPPARGLGKDAFITAMTEYEQQPIQIIDIELVIAGMYPPSAAQIDHDLQDLSANTLSQCRLLIVDDSAVARRQLSAVLDQLNVRYTVSNNGEDAYAFLQQAAQAEDPYQIVVSDIEMPGLDGYSLTAQIKREQALSQTYVILHTSLSSHISVSKAKSHGAEEALTKFDEVELAQAMIRGAQKYYGI